MVYLLDTNGVSDLVNQLPQVRRRLAALPAADQVVTCTVVVGEVAFGVERLPAGNRRDDLARRTATTLTLFSCAPISLAVAGHYA